MKVFEKKILKTNIKSEHSKIQQYIYIYTKISLHNLIKSSEIITESDKTSYCFQVDTFHVSYN